MLISVYFFIENSHELAPKPWDIAMSKTDPGLCPSGFYIIKKTDETYNMLM